MKKGARAYSYVDWKSYIIKGISYCEVAKIENMNPNTCYIYMKEQGYKVNIKRDGKLVKDFWNKPRQTSSLKYLKGHILDKYTKRNKVIPRFMKEYIKEMEK